MRRPILAANWKMHKTAAEAVEFAEKFLPLVEGVEADVVIAPPFTALDRLSQALAGSAVALAAQNVNPAPKGAFTGEVAPGMLVELGCRYAIVGHSERRAIYGESSALVARKAAALLEVGIRPIVCVGETLAEHESGRTHEVVREQLTASLAEVPEGHGEEVVIAYEPVWAIGTGKTATPEIAQDVHGSIRTILGSRFGDAGAKIRIQYGGSVKPDNVDALRAQPDIDGALVGGASLEPDSFARLVHKAPGGSS
ncbi:MAG: triose-phosphate isomerase [Myxococcota bacterium]|nr:triose-phosphate isomerase [Myxococcota bacterium]